MQEGLSRQLASTFREKIRSGEWAVGHRLPTTRALAATYQVSLNTVQNAFRELEARDLVVRRPRRGGFVKAPAHEPAPAPRATTVGIVGPYCPPDDTRQWNGWTSRITRAAQAELAKNDYHVSLFIFDVDSPEAPRRLLDRLDSIRSDMAGMICFPFAGLDGVLDQLDRRNIPWVTINRASERSVHNFVTADNAEGGRLVGRCFAELGFERILVLGLPLTVPSSASEKFFGLLRGYLEGGMPSRNVDYVMCDGFREPNGYVQFRAYVEKHGPPRAVFAVGDLLALGALRCCREMQLSVPEQVAIIGATGLDVAEYAHPSLTVLQQPMEAMGHEAVQMLMEMMRDNIRRLLGRYVPSPLIVRESLPMCGQQLKNFAPPPERPGTKRSTSSVSLGNGQDS